MKKTVLVLLTFFAFSARLFAESSVETEVFWNEQTVPGGVFTVLIPETPLYWEGTAVLEDSRRNRLASAGVFISRKENSGDSFFTFVIGVPTTAGPGEYSIRYELAGTKTLEGVCPVSLQPRDFLSEDIPLNRQLTAIRAEPDPRKEEEAKEFIEILRTFSKSAVFAVEKHQLPVENYITSSYFGDRRRYLYSDGDIAYSIHSGIDMAAPEGTSVYASGRGKVVFAADRIVTGKTIIIEHLPGVYGIYYHLHSIGVVRGDYVEKGLFIGTVGSTGLSTGNHLHWEIRAGQVPVDPSLFVESNVLDKAAFLSNHTGMK